MDVFSTIQTLKQATSSAPALSQTEQSQLLSACSDFLEVAMPIERKIMDWLFSVSLSCQNHDHKDLIGTLSATQGHRNPTGYRHEGL
jgi:hypothetical protein